MPARLLLDTDVLIDYLRGRAEAVAYPEGLQEPLRVGDEALRPVSSGSRRAHSNPDHHVLMIGEV
jgi:hypothetical protein